MAYFVLGKILRDFTNEQGEHVVGTNVWISQSLQGANAEGVEVNKYWLKPEQMKFEDIVLNKKCEVFFNNKGKVARIEY